MIIKTTKLFWGPKRCINWGGAYKHTIRVEVDRHVQSLGNGRQVEILCVIVATTNHERNNQRDNNVTLAITHGFLSDTRMNVPIT